MFKKISIQTSGQADFVNITKEIEKFIAAEKISNGIISVFVPHTTAGITLNEQADPDVVADIQSELEKMVPRNANFLHSEGNSSAHIKASIIGSSVQIIIEKGKPLLGTWQGVFFCEFDGPRHREIWMKAISC
ncbi:MAG: secondary thiamine-phosphate synthase enzyme YjbQ [bacterium]|nr:secondary thiamine-phosphate synthase enzyme YjbQ [bacterium]